MYRGITPCAIEPHDIDIALGASWGTPMQPVPDRVAYKTGADPTIGQRQRTHDAGGFPAKRVFGHQLGESGGVFHSARHFRRTHKEKRGDR